ncbi:hypothetical protein [Paracoccus benzoatiresistens]|uniref:Uncharacterized protein n=1 Tax=Paracoccus benzoatiresistens TaxID=2997341 RepID=A0ABT4J387_9RHOB|nr:hypothetical protein [Paracoccus sp. EF6]MCZ0961085.1 hypothetical protein [Paracoccus sp. EF6]
MDEYCICLRDNPHFRLTRDGQGFDANAAPLVFPTYEEAYDYTLQNNTSPQLEGVSVEIIKSGI